MKYDLFCLADHVDVFACGIVKVGSVDCHDVELEKQRDHGGQDKTLSLAAITVLIGFASVAWFTRW